MGGLPTQEAAAYLADRVNRPGLVAYCERTAERAANWAHKQDPRCPAWRDFNLASKRALSNAVLTHLAIDWALTVEPLPCE